MANNNPNSQGTWRGFPMQYWSQHETHYILIRKKIGLTLIFSSLYHALSRLFNKKLCDRFCKGKDYRQATWYNYSTYWLPKNQRWQASSMCLYKVDPLHFLFSHKVWKYFAVRDDCSFFRRSRKHYLNKVPLNFL